MISIGSFVVLFSFISQFVTELSTLVDQFFLSKNMTANISRIKSVFVLESNVIGKASFPQKIMSLTFDKVSFSYSENLKNVLFRVSLDFPIGKKIAIVGKSGCGKSSVLQLLLRLNKVKSGQICINGRNIDSFDISYTNHVSAVFQEPYFLPDSIITNLTWKEQYPQEEIDFLCKEMQCDTFIKDSKDGYDTFVGENASLLSGG